MDTLKHATSAKSGAFFIGGGGLLFRMKVKTEKFVRLKKKKNRRGDKYRYNLKTEVMEGYIILKDPVISCLYP